MSADISAVIWSVWKGRSGVFLTFDWVFLWITASLWLLLLDRNIVGTRNKLSPDYDFYSVDLILTPSQAGLELGKQYINWSHYLQSNPTFCCSFWLPGGVISVFRNSQNTANNSSASHPVFVCLILSNKKLRIIPVCAEDVLKSRGAPFKME